MRLDDFQMGARQMEDARSLTVMTLPVSEAIRMELGAHPPIEAPFGKLVVQLVPQDTDPWSPEHDGTVLQLGILINERAIRDADEATRTRLLLDVAEEAVRRSEALYEWDSSSLRTIIDDLREREDVGWIALERLSRSVRGRGSVKFFYEVRPNRTAVWAVVYGDNGIERSRFIVAEEAPAPLSLELFFPVSRSVVKGAAVELRAADGETLASINLA